MNQIDRDITVLVVDDKPRMRQTICNMMRKLGFQNLLEADDGDTALETLHSKNIDLVLCDWNMPRLPGIEVLRAVREDEKLKDLPFLLVTAEVAEATVAEAAEGDVDGYIAKPFTPEILLERVSQIWERRTTPSALETHLSLGMVYMKSRQYHEAAVEFRKALQINSSSPRTYHALGQLYEAQKDLKKAKAHYLKSIQLSSQFIKGHEALASVYSAMGDNDSAAMHLQKATNISPRNLNRQVLLGQTLVEAGRPADAQNVFKKVMRLAKENYSETAAKVGEALLSAGMVADAQEVFQQGLSTNPKDILLYNRLGIAYRKQGKHQEAIENYKLALTIDPESENLCYNLGRAYHEAGQIDNAISAMRKALKLYPDFDEAKEFLTKTLKAPLTAD